jgi:hypothetical protein
MLGGPPRAWHIEIDGHEHPDKANRSKKCAYWTKALQTKPL